jgi:hypothetical protein
VFGIRGTGGADEVAVAFLRHGQTQGLGDMVQAGAVRMTTVATVLEFQRDWVDKTHYDALMNIFREHGGGYGVGIEYAYTMVHKAPPARKILK